LALGCRLMKKKKKSIVFLTHFRSGGKTLYISEYKSSYLNHEQI
jgi:hypothetical protein